MGTSERGGPSSGEGRRTPFIRGDVVRVPFPYTDRNTPQHRPALVVSAGGDGGRLLWVLDHQRREPPLARGRAADPNHPEVGLPVPSLVRSAKIATIEARHADRLGSLPDDVREEVDRALREHLGLEG